MQKQALTPLDYQNILLNLAFGVPLGLSAAALTSLANKAKTDTELSEDTAANTRDDNVLYLNLPAKQNKPAPFRKYAAEEATPGTTGTGSALALTTGLLTTLGSYALVRQLYQKHKLAQLQAQLDKEQNRTLQAVSDDVTKAAGTGDLIQGTSSPGAPLPPRGMLSQLSSTALATLLLTGLGSGWLTHRMLSHMFPQVNKDIVTDGPPRVVVRRKPAPVEPAPDPDISLDKMAAWVPAATETAIGLAMELAKQAAHSDLLNLVTAVAQGRGPELEDAPADVLDLVKGAALESVPRWKAELAVSWLAKSATLRPTVMTLVAGELAEYAPSLWKQAQALDSRPDVCEFLVRVAAESRAHHIASLAPAHAKSASLMKQVPMQSATQTAETSLAQGIPDLDALLSPSHPGLLSGDGGGVALLDDLFPQAQEEDSKKPEQKLQAGIHSVSSEDRKPDA